MHNPQSKPFAHTWSAVGKTTSSPFQDLDRPWLGFTLERKSAKQAPLTF
jgi:hypothetical protein